MLTELETRLLGVMMMVIMLGMGASLTFKDFRIAFRKPQGILVGLACQYGIMPLLGYLLATLLGLPPAVRGDLPAPEPVPQPEAAPHEPAPERPET